MKILFKNYLKYKIYTHTDKSNLIKMWLKKTIMDMHKRKGLEGGHWFNKFIESRIVCFGEKLQLPAFTCVTEYYSPKFKTLPNSHVSQATGGYYRAWLTEDVCMITRLFASRLFVEFCEIFHGKKCERIISTIT